MLHGDSDGDGDAVFTTNNEEMIGGAIENGKPVTYSKVNAPKSILSYDNFFSTDVASFNSKIGLITNYGTSYYSMQSMFEKDSEEYKEIEKRLIICRRGQGAEIDKTKGILTSKFPEWGKKIPGDELHNKILCNKRPFWMQYLYPHKKKEWDEHVLNYDYYSYGVWGMSAEEIMNLEAPTKEQEEFINKFKRFSPLLLGCNGIMDLVSRKMISSVKEIKQTMKQKDFNYEIYMDLSVPTSTEIKSKFISLLWLYNRMKKDFYLNSSHEDVFFIVEHIKNKAFEISSDLTELTNCAVELFYGEKKSNHDFVWQIFSDGIIYNMLKSIKRSNSQFR